MSTEPNAAVNNNPLAEPVSELVGARFAIRAGAQIIDTIVHYPVWILSSLILRVAVGIYAGVTHIPVEPLTQRLSSPAWYGFIAAGLGYVFYHTVMEGMYGATLGKRVVGLAVVDIGGRPMRFRAALGRSFAFYVDVLFFGLIACSAMEPPLQQRVGDMWCNTVVLKRSMLPVGSTVAAKRFGVTLLLGILSDSMCYLASALVKLT